MTIELKPKESVTIGHDLPGMTHTLAVGESVTVTAVPAPSKKFARSIPGSTAVVNFILSNPSLLNPDTDAVGLLTGGGPKGVADPSWVNTQANRLRAVFPDLTIFAQVSGTKDVDTIARQCHQINAIAFVQESGFGIESDPWNPSQASTEARITKARNLANAQGLALVLHMSGKGVPWRSDDIPTWDYSRYDSLMQDQPAGLVSFPNVIQTQRDFQSDHEANNNRVDKAVALVADQCPDWLPQVTLDPDEVNGITHNTKKDPVTAFLALYPEPAGAGMSFWSLDTTGLARVLAETKDWTVLIFGRPAYRPHPGKPHIYVTGFCVMCERGEPVEAIRRGKQSRNYGNRAELAVAKQYGGRKVGHAQGPTDIMGTTTKTQLKTTRRAAPVMWVREFAKLDSERDGRLPRLLLRFVRPGVAPDDYIVVRGRDWLEWFGRDD